MYMYNNCLLRNDVNEDDMVYFKPCHLSKRCMPVLLAEKFHLPK